MDHDSVTKKQYDIDKFGGSFIEWLGAAGNAFWEDQYYAQLL